MSVSLSIIFNGYQSFLGNGLPNSGGYIYTYLAGTTTPATTYTNNGGAIANPNPIPLSASGNPLNPIWLTDGVAYKMVVVDKNLAQVPNATFDNVTGSAGGIFSFLLTLAASAGSSIIGFIQAGTGAVLRTVQDKLRERVTPQDFGAKGDGTTDDTSAVQAFFNYCLANRRGYVPATAQGYRLTAPIQVVGSCYVSGDGCVPYQSPQVGAVRSRGRGSWFFIDHTGIGFNLNNVNETTEMTFENIGTYRTQPTPITGWAPANCDYDFYCAKPNCDYTFRNVLLLNPTKGIFGNGRCIYDNVRGQPMQIGIYDNFCADTNRFTGCHFWPYWSDDASVKAYQLANTRAIQLLRVDNAVIDNCFSLWAYAFIQVSEGVNGGVSKLRVSNCDGDSGVYFLFVDATVVNGASIQIANCVSQGDTVALGSIGIYVMGANCRINVSNYVASACKLNAIRIDGSPNRLSFTNFRSDFWNIQNASFPAIEATAGNQIRVDGNFDYDGGNSAMILSGAAKYIGHIGGGSLASTTAGDGTLVVPHSFKAIPTRIYLQPVGPDAEIVLRVSNITYTTFTITAYRNNTAYSGAIQFTYEAWDMN